MFGSYNEVQWSDVKAFLDERSVPAQYIDFKNTYWILAIDGSFQVWCRISKGDPASADQIDFETNYKDLANTTVTDSDGHSVVRLSPFSSSGGFRARFKGFSGTAIKADTEGVEKITNIDFQITEERYINGVRIMLKNHSYGDCVDLIVVDKDYLYAGILYPSEYQPGVPWSAVAPNGVELDKFGDQWYVDDTLCTQPDVTTPYPARILSGLYIRVAYKAIGISNDILVQVNAYLHKKDSV